MRKQYAEKIVQISKISILLLFTFITIGSSPRNNTFIMISENNNLNKMVDIEQISSNKKIATPKVDEIIAVAEGIEETTTAALARLSIDMSLNEPSGFTLAQYKKALLESKNIGSDKYDVMKNNIELFYNVEQKYGINGIFLLSIGVLESGWGTSNLAIKKNNLFGLGGTSGMSFDSYEECIDYAAKILTQRYLNPKGAIVKGLEEPATGVHYKGETIQSVNQTYATSNEWTQKIYRYMEHFYGNIEK